MSEGVQAAVGRLTVLLSETAAGTALLYYFGWVRAHATFGYFGIDATLLDFSDAYYVLRSVDVATPLIGTLIIVLLLNEVHRRAVVPAMARWPAVMARGMTVASVACAVLAGVAVLAIVTPLGGVLGVGLPLTLVIVAVTLAYIDHLRAEDAPRTRAFVLVGLGVVGLLWSVAAYALYTGEQAAAGIAGNLDERPGVVLYAKERQAIAGPGVTVDRLPQSDSRYHFRYGGLRLLVQSADRYLLVPNGWHRGDSAYLVPITSDIRIDIRA